MVLGNFNSNIFSKFNSQRIDINLLRMYTVTAIHCIILQFYNTIYLLKLLFFVANGAKLSQILSGCSNLNDLRSLGLNAHYSYLHPSSICILLGVSNLLRYQLLIPYISPKDVIKCYFFPSYKIMLFSFEGQLGPSQTSNFSLVDLNVN